MNINNYAVVEIFAGAGGLGTGLTLAGLNIDIAVEIDPIASATYQKNHPQTVVWCRDIKDVTGQEIRSIIGNKQVILAGGPPCQSWSEMQEDIQGSKKGLEDPRGQLIYEYLRICEELQPEVVLFENVSYLVSEKHLPAFREFKGKLRQRTGLELEHEVLNSLEYGVGQVRERVIMMGTKPGVPNPFSKLKQIDGPKTLREALAGCPASEYAEFTPYEASIMAKIPAGKHWNVLPPVEAMKALGKDYRGICKSCGHSYQPQHADNCPKCGGTEFRNGYGVTSYWRRLSWDRPCYTVCTVLPTKPHGTLAHPDENRGLSYRECARLQGFPDDYQFMGTLKDKYRQIGNAVSVTLGKALGLAIIAVLDVEEPIYAAAKELLDELIQHPNKGMLTLLERDFLNTVYWKIKEGLSFPERHVEYLRETCMRLK